MPTKAHRAHSFATVIICPKLFFSLDVVHDYSCGITANADGEELARWVIGEKGVRASVEAPDPVNPAVLAMVDFVAPTQPSKRQDLWEPIFLPDPASLIGAVEEALKRSLSKTAQVNQIVDTLRSYGWLDTERLYREHARDAKRDWSRITGENFGVRKAQTWPPPFHTSVLAAPGAQHMLAISKSSSPYARTTK